jgi:S-DNA-T family DNA segregation ATPase FtsK/SpoIIIE
MVMDGVDLLRKFLIFLGTILGVGVLWLIIRGIWRCAVRLSSERRQELLGLFLLVLGLLLLLSLVSYRPEDIGHLDTGHGGSNWGGLAGLLVSHGLVWSIGLSAFAVPVCLIMWGVNRLRQDDPERLVRWTVLAAGGIVVFCLVVALVAHGRLFWNVAPGGRLGAIIAGQLVRFVGTVGSYLVALVLIWTLLLMTTPFSLRRWMERLSAWRSNRAKQRVNKRSERQAARAQQRQKSQRKERPKERRTREVSTEYRDSSPPVETIVDGEMSDESRGEPEDASWAGSGDLNDSFRHEFLSILADPDPAQAGPGADVLKENAAKLIEKLRAFGVEGEVVDVRAGPVISRYEFRPSPGVKVSRIAALADDLALAMKASRIRIVAPIPGRSVVGIEIPNERRISVALKEIVDDPEFVSEPSPLTVALGKSIAGDPYFAAVTDMPHLLIAGATGSGKSVCINAMVASILYRATPQEVRFLMIDPKRLELPVYNGIPHLVGPVITEGSDSLKALKRTVGWMELRYREFARVGVRDLEGYNSKVSQPKPAIVVMVDELADLMFTAPSEIEETLTRLAQMSRAVGIHLILATQRPSVDVITGLIKANFPARIAFQVASKTDSRTILDMNGAEKLLGKGDMLFLPPGTGNPVRLHGAYISTQEAKEIAQLWTAIHLKKLLGGRIPKADALVKEIVRADLIDSMVHPTALGREERLTGFSERVAKKLGFAPEEVLSLLHTLDYYPSLAESVSQKASHDDEQGDYEQDELFDEARRLVIRHQIASVSLLQRRLKVGYTRASRMIDQLEMAGVVGPYVGSKAREVLVKSEDELPEDYGKEISGGEL